MGRDGEGSWQTSAPQRRRDRQLLGAGILSLCGVFGVFVWPMLVGRVYVRGELGITMLVARAFYRGALLRGDAFDWWPDLDGGLFIHGLGFLGLYHPAHLLGYWAVPLPWAFHAEVFLSYPLALVGMLWLLRRWALSLPAAFFGGSLFALCGFSLLHHVHTNVVAVTAHIPYLLVAIDVLLRDPRPRRRVAAFLALTLLTGSQLLLHFPQVVVMSAQLEVAYCLAVGLTRGGLKRALPWLLAAKMLGVCLGAVQLLPSWDYIHYTVRDDVSLAYRYTMSLPPVNWIQLVAPYLFRLRYWEEPGRDTNTHEFGLYDGALSVALVVWVLLRLRDLGPRRPVALALLVLLAVGVDLSLGRYGLLYHVQVRLPVVGLFRAPCRNILLAHFALAGLGALAFEDLRRIWKRREPLPARRLWALGLLPALALAVAALASQPSLLAHTPLGALAPQLGPPRGIWLGPAVAAAAALLVAGAARGWAAALPLLVLFSAADQGYYGLSYMNEEPPVSYQEFKTPPPLPAPEPGYRIHGGVSKIRDKTPNIFALWGYRVANSYPGVPVVRELNYTRSKPLRLAGVQWLYRNDLPEPKVMPLADPMPRVRLVTRVVVHDRPALALRHVDIATTAVVPKSIRIDLGAPGTAELVDDRPGRIRVVTDTKSRQLLILNEKQLAGWRVSVDGVPRDLVRVYGDFMGCVVDAGRHEVVFRFDPKSLRLGRAISLAGLIATAGLSVGLWIRTRERR